LSPLRVLNSALSLLTIIPTPNFYPGQPGRAYAAFPLVGLLIGWLLWAVAWGAGQVFPPEVTAWVVVLAWVVITGGLHLDGFGDSCDGLCATVSVERRLEIMKDSRAGSWAVVGLGLLLLGKWVGAGSAPVLALVVAPVVGRLVMTVAAYSFPYARQEGMGGYFRDGLGRPQVAVAVLTTLLVVGWLGRGFVAHLGTVLVLVALAAWWAARRLGGGLTGDTYGALCELTEVLVLLALSA
jgi:adenosylcobinamide-GDP ribazoletransferase